MRSGCLKYCVVVLFLCSFGCRVAPAPADPGANHDEPADDNNGPSSTSDNTGDAPSVPLQGVWADPGASERGAFALWTELDGKITGQWSLGSSYYDVKGSRGAAGELELALAPIHCAPSCEVSIDVTLASEAAVGVRDNLSVSAVKILDPVLVVPLDVGDVFVPHDGFKPENAPIDTEGLVELDGAGLGAFVGADGELSTLNGTCAFVLWSEELELSYFGCDYGVVDDRSAWETTAPEALVVEGDYIGIALSEDVHLVGELLRDVEGQIEGARARFVRGTLPEGFSPRAPGAVDPEDVVGSVFLSRRQF